MNERIINFLNENKLHFFATIGLDQKPKVRPFELMEVYADKLYYCTASNKQVYKELIYHPDFEICASSQSEWVRIKGKPEWMESKALKQHILDTHPQIAAIYGDAENADFKVFTVSEGEISISDLSGRCEKQKI